MSRRWWPGPGIGFAAVGRGTHPPGTLARMAGRLVLHDGAFRHRRVIDDVVQTTDMLCRDGPDVLERIGADAIVADQTEAAGGLLARRLGLPQISVANALLINREPLVPPPFIGWAYDDTEWGLKRNRGGYRVADWMMRPLTHVIRRYAQAWELGPLASLEDCLSPLLQISQSVEGFDFPRRNAPAALVHVGPLRRPETEAWPARDARPLVFCSLGTLQGGRASIFRKVAEACRDRDLSAADRAWRQAQRRRDRGTARFAAGRSLCAAAGRDGACGRGGHAWRAQHRAGRARGRACRSWSCRSPSNRARSRPVSCAAAPASRSRRHRLTASRIGAARLTGLLTDPAYRGRAAALAQEIAQAGGVERACDLIEAVLVQPWSSVSS